MDGQDNFGWYTGKLSQFPRLTPEEEMELGMKNLKGDSEARKKLITSHLQYVVGISKGFWAPKLERLDLIQGGNMGLMSAVDNGFDPREGSLRTFSYNPIRWGMIEALRQSFLMSPSKGRLSQATSVRSLSDSLRGDVDADTLFEIITDESVSTPLEDVFASDSIKFLRRDMGKILTSNELKIMTMRFGLRGVQSKTRSEISKLMGVTYQRVEQIEKAVLHRIKTLIDVGPEGGGGENLFYHRLREAAGAKFQEYFQELDDVTRVVLYLRFERGYSSPQIKEAFQHRVQTVNRCIKRGLKELGAKIDARSFGDNGRRGCKASRRYHGLRRKLGEEGFFKALLGMRSYERQALSRFETGETLKEIGNALGVRNSRVYQEQALDQLEALAN